jgi:hypothetical protein
MMRAITSDGGAALANLGFWGRSSFVIVALVALLRAETNVFAQEAGGSSAGPGLPAPTAAPAKPETNAGQVTVSRYETVVIRSPDWTQDRNFAGTRFWKLDQGSFAIEQWWRLREPREGDGYQLLQTELAIGLSPRIQLDIYENLTNEEGSWTHEGNQIEARIAFDPVYGRTPLNPVLYLEWHPRHLAADRAEARLLGGGQIWGPQLVGAVNLFYEQNVTKSMDGYVANPEMGITAAAGFALTKWLRGGAETKFALEKERWSDAEWEKQLLVGPNVTIRVIDDRLRLHATVLFGVTDDAKKIDSFVIASSTF